MFSLNRRIDGASLIFLRVFAYGLMTWEIINSLFHGDWITYTTPRFHFSYLFLPWLTPLPPLGMGLIFSTTILSGLFSCLGLWYRWSSIAFFLSFTSIFLMEASEYINHLYFYSLLSFWMCLMPLNQEFSLDVKLKKVKEKSTLPFWMLFMILFHVSAAYFFAGVAKLSPHWIDGSLPRLLLQGRGIRSDFAINLMTFGGLFFDLLIAPALIYKRTRKLAVLAALGFHLINVALFGLVTFPWMMILLSTLYFDPSWPRRLLKTHIPNMETQKHSLSRSGAIILSLYVLLQMTIPLRHYLHDLDPSWSEEGHQFSWRMKTRVKRSVVRFTVRDELGKIYPLKVSDYLTPKQEGDMAGKPDLILQFAHFIRDEHRREGRVVRVEASSRVSLNGRAHKELIQPGIDLSREERNLLPYKWIVNN